MENEIAVNMKQIQQILAGSQRLNQMKWEIDAIIGIARGFLTKQDVAHFRYHEIICAFTTPGLSWEIIMCKRDHVGINASVHVGGRGVYAYSADWGSSAIEMSHVQLVHQALPDILTNLVRIFPSLTARFAPLLRAASTQTSRP